MLLSNDGIEGSSGSSIDMVKLSSDFHYSILDFVMILIEWHSVCVIDQCMGGFQAMVAKQTNKLFVAACNIT